MSDQAHLTLEQVHALATDAFLAHGVSPEQTRAVADTVTAAERDGCKSHGLFRVPGYLKSVVSGKITPDAVPAVDDLAPAVVKVDAMNGFAPLALERGRGPLVDKARSQGIAALAVTNSYHFAALWPEVEALAEQGLAAFAFVSSSSFVAPAGGTKALSGTNPMAFAWPRDGKPPLVFDQASSASARGEIQIHLRDGKPIPQGWGIDADGNASTDPAAVLAGAQLCFGGYKGAAIALMVELLAGALIGDAFSFEATARDNKDGGPARGGEFLMAIDPTRCVSHPGAQLAHAEGLFARILEQNGTRLPSDRRYAARERTPADGVDIPAALFETVTALTNGPAS
ncbi:MAG: Ldh family oxidoreductase [Gammaproteobacteria bacterium]